MALNTRRLQTVLMGMAMLLFICVGMMPSPAESAETGTFPGGPDNAATLLAQLQTSPVRPVVPSVPKTAIQQKANLTCPSGAPISSSTAGCLKVVWSKKICNEDGRQSVQFSPNNMDVDWQGGRIFAGSYETNRDYGTALQRLRAFRFSDGAQIWEKRNTSKTIIYFGALAYTNGRIFNSWTGLDAFNANDGSLLWQAPPFIGGGGYSNAWIIAKNQNLYANPTIFDKSTGQSLQYLQVLDQATGTERLRYKTGWLYSQPLIIGNAAYANMGISGMVFLDLGKPALMWSIAPSGLSKTSKGFYNNQVYLGVGSEIFAVDSATGKITQRYALPKCVTYTNNPGQQYCFNYAKGVLSPFTLSIDRAVFINSSGDLQALNLQTGSLLWSTLAGGSTTIYENIAPAVVNGVVITSSWKTTYNASNLSVNTYGVNVYDVTSGQELASVPTGTLMVLDIKVAPDGSAIVVRTPEDLIFLATR